MPDEYYAHVQFSILNPSPHPYPAVRLLFSMDLVVKRFKHLCVRDVVLFDSVPEVAGGLHEEADAERRSARATLLTKASASCSARSAWPCSMVRWKA